MHATFDTVPRPPHHPVLGHLPEWVGKRAATRILDTLLAYAEACGPVARIPLGPARLALLSDPDVIGAFLRDKHANHKGWPYVLTRVVLDNVLLLNGERWASARATFRRALEAADVTAAGDRALDRAIAGWGGDRDLQVVVRDLAADVVVGLLCRGAWDPALEPHRERVQHELAAVGIDMQCQPWAYASPARWVAMRRSVAAMRAFFAAHVAARLRGSGSRAGEDRADVLGGFLREDAPMDAEALTDALVSFFFTAHDVLTSSTAWCLWLLASHPSWQTRARHDEATLAMAVRESLRLYPGYPLFSRRTQAPVEVGGATLPAGTDVIVSPWVVHRLARHWEDPLAFDPERWRDRLGPVAPHPRGGYMPFGGGFRGCIASAVALPLMTRIVGRAIDEHAFEARPGHAPDVVYWGSTSSANGLPVRIAPHR